jgi:hypothetical protein
MNARTLRCSFRTYSLTSSSLGQSVIPLGLTEQLVEVARSDRASLEVSARALDTGPLFHSCGELLLTVVFIEVEAVEVFATRALSTSGAARRQNTDRSFYYINIQ